MNYNVIEIEKKKKKAEMEEKKIFFVFFIVCKTDREYRCFGQRNENFYFLREKKNAIVHVKAHENYIASEKIKKKWRMKF